MRHCVLIGLLFSAPVLANQLDAIVVDGAVVDGAARLSPAPLQRQAELFEQSRATAVVDLDDAQQGVAANQEDIFKRTPGVWVSNENGGDDVFLSIRGSGLSASSFGRGIVSYQDGVPMAALDRGTTNQLIDPMAYRYLEVYRGASALTLGSSALGGAINYVSHTGHSAPGVVLRSEVGSHGWRTNRLTAGGQQGAADGFVTLGQSDYRGYREQSGQYNKRASGNLGYRFSNGVENRSYFSFDDAQLQLPGRVPRDRLREDRRQAADFNKQFDADRNWRAARFANRTAIPLADQQQLVASVFYNYGQLDHLPTPFVGIIDNRSESVGSALDYQRHWDQGHRLLMGLRFSYGDDHNRRFQQSADGRAKRAQIRDERFQVRQWEAYAEQQWQVDEQWRLSLGAQWVTSERQQRDNFDHDNGPACGGFPPQPCAPVEDGSFRSRMGGFSPKLGMSYLPVPGQTLFAQVAASLGMPSSGEQGTQPEPGVRLDQQDALTYELGWRGVSDWLDWDLVAYRMRVSDELLNLTINDSTALFNSPERTIHQGLEAGLLTRLPLAQDVSIHTVYNYADFRFAGGPRYGRNQLPGIPEHTLFMALQWRPLPHTLLEPNLRAVKGYPLTYSNEGGDNWSVPSYTLFGLRLSQMLGDLRVFAEGRNLTDKVYASSGAIVAEPSGFGPDPVAQVIPGVGRSYFLGVEYRL